MSNLISERRTRIAPHLKLLSTVLFLVLAADAQAETHQQVNDRFTRLFNGDLNIVDLTYSLSEDSLYWPNKNGNPFHYKVTLPHADGTAQMGAYEVPEHHGTHLDAPSHARQGLATVDTLSVKQLFGPAVVVDISAQSKENADYTLSVKDLQTWESEYGPITKRAIVLLNTGWSKKSGDQKAYANQDSDGVLHFPGFSSAAAHWLLDNREIRGIGIDNLSVDPGTSSNYPVHDIVNGAGKIHLENVANIHLLPPVGVNLIVAPNKVKGGSGGHVRIYAVLPD